MKKSIYLAIILPLLFFSCIMEKEDKPIVMVSTDIGGSDPDDFQSMVHFFVYGDMLRIEGLIASPPHSGRKEDIFEVIDAYEKDYENLKTYGPYPEPYELRAVSKQGATETGPPREGGNTMGSDFIIKRSQEFAGEPIYLLVWGSLTDVAQALFDAPQIKSNLRVYSIGSWNTRQDTASRNYIFNNHPDLWWIESDKTFRGMYEGGHQEGDYGNVAFVEKHVKGHGALGDLFYQKKKDIKMGDTPSLLYVLSPMLSDFGNYDYPENESWGGKYRTDPDRPYYWTDIEDDRAKDAQWVNKHRKDYLDDWAKRMDRCKEPE